MMRFFEFVYCFRWFEKWLFIDFLWVAFNVFDPFYRLMSYEVQLSCRVGFSRGHGFVSLNVFSEGAEGRNHEVIFDYIWIERKCYRFLFVFENVKIFDFSTCTHTPRRCWWFEIVTVCNLFKEAFFFFLILTKKKCQIASFFELSLFKKFEYPLFWKIGIFWVLGVNYVMDKIIRRSLSFRWIGSAGHFQLNANLKDFFEAL